MHRTLKLGGSLICCLLLIACGSSQSQPEMLPGKQLPESLSEQPVPEGISPTLWQELTQALAVSLAESGRERQTSNAPSGIANLINDFLITTGDDDRATLSWTYRNVGDYDLNGEVNIGDLTPIGIHFGKSPQSPDWNQAQVADGDANGEVNIADISPIGQNFGNIVTGYELADYNNGGVAQDEPEASQVFAEIAFTASSLSDSKRTFAYDFAPASHFKGYLTVRAFHEVAELRSYGDWSNDGWFSTSATLDPLIASQGTLEGQVELNWSAVKDPLGYSVQRAATVSGPFTEIGSTTTSTTYLDTTAAPGVHYWYQVRTYLDPGLVAPSSTMEGWAAGPPLPPSDLLASNGTLADGIELTWTPPSGVSGYKIYRDASDNLIDTIGDTAEYLDLDTTFPDEHTYWISAVEPHFGYESELSGPVTGYRGELVTVTTVSPQKVLTGVDSTFSVTFTGGEAPFSFSWDFGGGAAPNTSTDQAPTVTPNVAGEYAAGVQVTSKAGSVTHAFPLSVVTPVTDLLVVYNSDIPASLDLANYYVSPETGRAIHPEYQLGLPLGTGDTSIAREAYATQIAQAITAHLDSTGQKDIIKYIVLMKGVPHMITGTDQCAVDSELCLLYANAPTTGRLFSATSYLTFNNSGFYEAQDGVEQEFAPFTHECSTETNSTFTVSYLVGRISAYTYAEAKLSIDRSLAADTNGLGYVIMDTHTGWNGSETMVDPVWPFNQFDPPLDVNSLDELLGLAGYNRFLDNTFDFITPDELPSDAVRQKVIGYTGWGVNHTRNGSGINPPSGKLYILDDFGELNYLPGACWIVYESYSGRSFSWDGDPATHDGQGQICDFIRMGGTVAAGNCYEPFTDGVPDERRVFERYLVHGDRWIEAAYKGVRYFSWHTIVLGDPLCRVKP